MMTLSIPLPPEAEAALRQRASAAGKDPAVVASELLTHALASPPLTRQRLLEISGDSYQRFQASGVTDEQLGDDLERAKHSARAAKRGITFSE